MLILIKISLQKQKYILSYSGYPLAWGVLNGSTPTMGSHLTEYI